MEINHIPETNIGRIGRVDVYDIPGQPFFKTKIVEFLPLSRKILLFLDSSEK